MSYLYVNEQGARIGVDGGYVTVQMKDDLLRKIPSETLENISLFGNISISTQAMQRCLKLGITLNFFSSNGKYYGHLTPTARCQNHNHQLNWWFALALKGPYASSVSRRTEKVCQPHDFLRLRLKALFYYLLFLATRERVDIFFHTYLVICDVLLQLISDVLFYRFFVSSNCIYIISSTPEMSISIFIF